MCKLGKASSDQPRTIGLDSGSKIKGRLIEKR